MFFRKRKRPYRPHQNAATVRWIVLGITAIALISNWGKKDALQTHAEAAKDSIIEAAPKLPVDVRDYKKLLPVYDGPPQIKDIATGEGPPLICGETATIAYSSFRNDDTAIDDSATADQPLKPHIGDHKIVPSLEQGVVGMRKGGKRIIYASPQTAYGAKGFARQDVAADVSVRFEVELLDIYPILPELKDTPYRIFTQQRGAQAVH